MSRAAAPRTMPRRRLALDPRAPLYVIGLLVATLGASMVFPLAADLANGDEHAYVFLESAVFTFLTGALIAFSCANAVRERLSIQQLFFITSGVWAALPVFAGIPLMVGATRLGFTDAYFEAMSGLTTTGSTVLSGLETLPKGILLWRGMLQWFGGIGIIVVAMGFLPELKVGGMQIFRSEAFDTFGKVLPRAAEMAARITWIYAALTVACALTYIACGMSAFDGIVHGMTTISTGGLANTDASFAAYSPAAQWACTLFMALAALPFVRYIQLVAGHGRPLVKDTQVRGFVATALTICLVLSIWRMRGLVVEVEDGGPLQSVELVMRESFFNTISIMTGTGYASTDYALWGAFPVAVIFFTGLIGGCAGSTACSAKIFRYQILLSAIYVQVRRIHQPSGVFQPRYDGRPVGEDVLSSVMSFFVLFLATLGVLSICLGATGLDMVTSLSGSVAVVANIGPGLGDIIGPAGNFAQLPAAAKWMLSVGMLIGRLEVLVVLTLFVPAFWRT